MRHAISCTILKVGDKRTQLAMCGASLGEYADATAAGHMAANYLSSRNVAQHVDCPECIGHVTNGTGAPITIARLQAIELELKAVHAPKCYCPDDCNCRKPWRTTHCGCRAHD